MMMYETKVDHIYSLKIDHNVWNDTVILMDPDYAGMYSIICLRGASDILGQQTVDKNCYLADRADYTLIGHKSKHPEFFL